MFCKKLVKILNFFFVVWLIYILFGFCLKNGFIMKKSDSGHCFETLLPNFKHFFDRSELTDLTVICEDGSVQTFRLLLASVSEYLKGTWTGCPIVLFVPTSPAQVNFYGTDLRYSSTFGPYRPSTIVCNKVIWGYATKA